MQRSAQNKTELLAPAGSLEAFFAAMEKGADAVYAGLKEFSARAKAKNFSLHQMERMLAYAHANGRKVYVTLNTLVKERELPQLVETLSALEGMGADAVIVQDMAVARLARKFFPSLPVHASTQMTVHNTPGVQQLAALGFERVVLARELHLDEIGNIVRNSPIGIECFIHGALCFSFSGQCYFSSFLGGHSGNRGRCAQPCRRQYKYRGKEGYYFSTNDFSSIDLIPQLVEAGVCSFKIEGRMKSAEYVACVVEAYRLTLDATPKQWPDALAAAKEILKRSFGRVPTKGFLASHQPTDIATPSLRGATGRFLGEIASIRGDRLSFTTKDRLHVGDRIRIQPKSDMAGKAFTIKELFVANRPTKLANAGTQVVVPSPFPGSIGDAVFKVSSETAFTMSEAACAKRLESAGKPKLPCDLQTSFNEGVLRIEATCGGISSSAEFPLGVLEPSRTAEMQEVLSAQFSRTGDTPFILRSLAAPEFPALMIPPAKLKEIRRSFYLQLAESTIPALKRERASRNREALASLAGTRGTMRGPTSLTVRIEHLRDIQLLNAEGVASLSLPVSKANLHELHLAAKRLKGKEGRISWRLPFIIFDRDLPWYREALAALAQCGFRRFEAANISHFQLLEEIDAEITTDYRLFSLNSQAILSWEELGANRCTLYIEDDLENLGDLLAADLDIERRIMIYGSLPAITSKIAIKGVKSDMPVQSDRGDSYRVTQKDGLTVITPTTPFSFTAFREKLESLGCSSFIADLGQLAPNERLRVLDAWSSGRELPGSSPFNFTMGLV
ncbi:U32 family peptidase [Geobacter pelophilus]|uniref:U32 family peptidase n=1 Tax=Geoanaerobacter pelophilus TaxID=60036 RepID=A0AAW4L328_9BACT|nr:U32 family peptidase [Geoanaerobacter pelophilus]MBT0665343.1 U32 family peptidase [Geoanaerobacter pelophilus]